VTPRELLAAAADAADDSPERALLITAAVEAILGTPAVLVGGAAVNTYTGEYRPTDIDIVAAVGKAERARLVEHGFVDPGVGHRHLQLPLGDGAPVFVEFPGGGLVGERYEEVEVAPGVVARVISLTDLVADRLRQATDGTRVTFEAAVALVTATFDDIDWDDVDGRIRHDTLSARMEAARDEVRAAAVRALEG
jgi:hypothetical protein